MKLTQLEMGKCLKTILFPKRIVKRRRGKSITKQSPRKNHTDYSKRDLKEIAYTEIATSLDTNITSIKAKISSLRTQLGREM